MNKSKVMLTTMLLIGMRAQSQFFTGLRGSYYGGITNVTFNPAIANSPFMVDINLIAAGANINNNYIGVSNKALTHPSLFSSADFKSAYLHERVNGHYKRAYAGLQIQGPLSVMVSFGNKKNKNKNALAFSYHANMVVNADRVTETLARTFFYGLGPGADAYTGYNGQSINNLNLSVKAAAWNDFGITYSRVVYSQNKHLIVAGGTLKLLQPIAGANGYIKNLNYSFNEYNQLSIYNTDVKYAYSNNLDNMQNAASYLRNAMAFGAGTPTAGADLGVVYQWWPEKSAADAMDCHCETFTDAKHYKLAAGFSVIDMGALRFKRDADSRDFTADVRNWDVSNVQFPDGLQSLNDTIDSRFMVHPSGKYFTVILPTRFNLFVDYYIRNDFAVTATAVIAPNLSPKQQMVHHVTTFSVIPKYDNKWLGVYLPLSFDVMGNVSLGTTLRLGPLTIGTQDLLGLFAKKFTYNADIHAALKLTIPYFKRCTKGDMRFEKKNKSGFSGFKL